MPIKDDLGKRIKGYEQVAKTVLMKRTPVMIRIDGRAFHTFTRGFKKPFDNILVKSMQETMKYLCENIQGCKFGYTQSDEITLVLTDYDTLTTDAWFDYEVQKMCSIAASMATMYFNKVFSKNVENEIFEYKHSFVPQSVEIQKKMEEYHDVLKKATEKGAMFDARCFNISKEEVTNAVYWRQLDAARNSIQMVGQANFSHKELQNKTCAMIQEMLFSERGINWNNYPTYLKRGSACKKVNDKWEIDLDMPMLKGEDRQYLEEVI